MVRPSGYELRLGVLSTYERDINNDRLSRFAHQTAVDPLSYVRWHPCVRTVLCDDSHLGRVTEETAVGAVVDDQLSFFVLLASVIALFDSSLGVTDCPSGS